MPTPIYAQGTELNAGDCMSAVGGAVAMSCARANNCAGLSANDIRPAVMTQLSTMSGHNYIAQCAGFFDAAFENYKSAQTGLNLAAGPVAFPTGARPVQPATQWEITNPHAVKPKDTRLRDELAAIQEANAPDVSLRPGVGMPTDNIATLSFAQRMENRRQGYEPYKDMKAYNTLKIEDNATFIARQRDEAKLRKERDAKIQEEVEQLEKLNKAKDWCGWCKENPAGCLEELNAKFKVSNQTEHDAACKKIADDKTRKNSEYNKYVPRRTSDLTNGEMSKAMQPDKAAEGQDCGVKIVSTIEKLTELDCLKFEQMLDRDFCKACKHYRTECSNWAAGKNKQLATDACPSGKYGIVIFDVHETDPDLCNESTGKVIRPTKQTTRDCGQPSVVESLVQRQPTDPGGGGSGGGGGTLPNGSCVDTATGNAYASGKRRPCVDSNGNEGRDKCENGQWQGCKVVVFGE
jgi:hypothetical protein